MTNSKHFIQCDSYIRYQGSMRSVESISWGFCLGAKRCFFESEVSLNLPFFLCVVTTQQTSRTIDSASRPVLTGRKSGTGDYFSWMKYDLRDVYLFSYLLSQANINSFSSYKLMFHLLSMRYTKIWIVTVIIPNVRRFSWKLGKSLPLFYVWWITCPCTHWACVPLIA